MTPQARLGQGGRPGLCLALLAVLAVPVLLMQRACVYVEEDQSGLGLQALRQRRQTGKLKLTPPKRYST